MREAPSSPALVSGLRSRRLVGRHWTRQRIHRHLGRRRASLHGVHISGSSGGKRALTVAATEKWSRRSDTSAVSRYVNDVNAHECHLNVLHMIIIALHQRMKRVIGLFSGF